MCFTCFSNRVTIASNTFQGDEKNIVDQVARLVKMCGNRSRDDEFIMILYGVVMFSKAFLELAFGLPNVLLFAYFTVN